MVKVRVLDNPDYWEAGVYWDFAPGDPQVFGLAMGPWSFELVVGTRTDQKLALNLSDARPEETVVTGVDGLRTFLAMIEACWREGRELTIEQTVRFRPSTDNTPVTRSLHLTSGDIKWD